MPMIGLGLGLALHKGGGVVANLVAEVQSSTAVKLSFSALNGAASYEERHSVSGAESWSGAAAFSSGSNVTGLTPAVLYDFQVRAVLASGATTPWTSSATTITLSNELLANGKFASNDLTSWDNDSTGIGTATGATGAAVLVGTNSSNRGRISQGAAGHVAGQRYQLGFDVSGSTYNIAVENTKGAADGPLTRNGIAANDGNPNIYSATQATHRFRIETFTAGGTVTVDNATMRKLLAVPLPAPSARPRLFLDFDHDSDIDDALDLPMLLAMQKAREIDLIGICVSSANVKAAPAVLATANYYGYGSIPVGANTAALGTSTGPNNWVEAVAAAYALPGKGDASDFENGITATYRRELANSPDRSVTIITGGTLSSLSALLKTVGDGYSSLTGLELVQAKVRAIYIAAGYWPTGASVSDMGADIPAGQYVLRNCVNVPICLVDLAMGDTVLTGGGGSITNLASDNPVRLGWGTYFGRYNVADSRPGWTQLAILAAVRGLGSRFTLTGADGTGVLAAAGTTSWNSGVNSNHSYFTKLASDAALIAEINALLDDGP